MGHSVMGGLVKQEKEVGGVGLYYIIFFFKCDYYILYYTKNKREIDVNVILYYIIIKNKKTREGVVGGFILYKNITFFFKCKVHLQNFTKNNYYDYIYKMSSLMSQENKVD